MMPSAIICVWNSTLPEGLLGFSVFCSCIFRSPKSFLATRILNIHTAKTRDPMGGVIPLIDRAYPIVYPKLSTFLLWALKTFTETSVFQKLKLIYLQSPKSSEQKGQLSIQFDMQLKLWTKFFNYFSAIFVQPSNLWLSQTESL